MDYELRDRAAIVTGGGAGIGAAVARTLAASGAAVLVADIHAPSARGVADAIAAGGGRAEPFEVDVTDPAAVDAAVGAVLARYGHIDILVNADGIINFASQATTVALDQQAAYCASTFAVVGL